MSKTPSSTSTTSTSKRPRAGKESVRTTRRSRSNEEGLPVEEHLRLLEGSDAKDPVEEEKDSGRKRVSAKVPPRARGRSRKVPPAAEVVAMASETGEKEKVQGPAEKDIDQHQRSSEREMTQQESAKETITQDEKEIVPLEDDKKVDGSAPENEGSSVVGQASAGNVGASGQQDEDDKDSSSTASAVELEVDDNEDDDGGFDIKEGDEITVLSNANGAAVELKRGDTGATQGPDEMRKEDDEQLHPAQDQENQEPFHIESSAPATIARKSSRVSSTASDNGSTASMDTHTKASSASKRKLNEQPYPELPAQQAQKNTSKEKKKKQKTIAKISPASSRNLFQFTCKLLESQRLEYEVRAREFEEKYAVLAVKRAKWEKKIRSVKRQLRGYGHPVDGVYDETNSGAANGNIFNRSNSGTNPDWGTSTALATTSGGFTSMNSSSSGSSTSLITMRDAFSSRTSFPSGVGGPGGVDSLLPASIHNIEAQIRDTLGSRANLVNDMIKELQTMRGLNDKITRLR